MNDGSDVNRDLTGGWYDAGDHVKFNFPMAFSATALAWGAIDFRAGYVSSGQLNYLKRNLRWVNDYFIKCHTSPNELWGQVGNGGADHAWWGSAEVMKMARPAYKIDASKPGSDLAAETAAAMAAASIVFASDDPSYSATLLQHAVQLYNFADNYRGVYSDAITDAAGYYRSYSGYNDELVWGAIWLYRATGQQSWLDKAEAYYANLSNEPQSEIKSYKWGLAWDDKSYGCYALLAKITGKAQYKADMERHLDYWTDGYNGDRISYTPGGLAFLDVWGALRYANNTGFLAIYYQDIASSSAKSAKYYNFALSQMRYALGSNPRNSSYVVGFGNNPTKNPHHRTAHGCWSNNQNGPPADTRHILYGALAGGPSSDDSYSDDRSNYTNNEVACDYNACFSGVLAALVEEVGGSPLSNFPVAEVPSDEYFIEAKSNAAGTTYSEWAVWARNHTAWPAREGNEYKYRLYIDISEGIAAGYFANDYVVSANSTGVVSLTGLIPWDEAENMYYVEVTYNSDIEIWPGGQQYDGKESQIRIRLPYEAPASAWDPANDPASQGVDGTLKKIPTIPFYVDGELVFGVEPDGGNSIPAQSVSVSPLTATLEINETQQLTATVLPVNATNKNVTWSSGNTLVATVSSGGSVTAVSAGNATITVRTQSGGYTATSSITVNAPPVVPVTAVNLSATSLELDVNESAALLATVLPSNATDKSISWSSNNPSIASVNASGVVTGISEGSATITVSTSNPSVSGTCTVTVSDIIVEPTEYTLTTSTAGSGSISLNPAGGVYLEGSSVTLTAIAAAGYQFDNWSGDASGTSASTSIIMNANKSVTANFSPVSTGGDCDNPSSITLPFQQNGAGTYCYFTNGTIGYINSWNMSVVEVNGTDFTNVWSNSMPARVDEGYYIYYQSTVGWSHLEITGTNGSTEPAFYSLTTSVTGQGTITPSSGSFEEGSTVTLTAAPAAGYLFTGWSGDATGSNPSVSIIMNADKVVSATFTEDIEDPVFYDLTVSVVGLGSVTPNSGSFGEGTIVTLTASAEEGYVFSGWSGAVTGTSSTVSLTMNANKSVVATFTEESGEPVYYDLTVSTMGLGSVIPDGGTFEEGTSVTLTATPAAGYVFQGWSGDATGTSSSVAIVMNTDKTVTATFEEEGGTEICSSPVAINIPFVQNGAGQYCWVTETEIAYINSWNLASLEINGVDFTNTWSNNLPPAIDGKWYISYDGPYGWSHFEAPAAKASYNVTTTRISLDVYPNPSGSAFSVIVRGAEATPSISVFNQQGQKIDQLDNSRIDTDIIELGSEYPAGIYFVQIIAGDNILTTRIIKE
jgi:uncharacterized repeat protein (TIGR02543 family)